MIVTNGPRLLAIEQVPDPRSAEHPSTRLDRSNIKGKRSIASLTSILQLRPLPSSAGSPASNYIAHRAMQLGMSPAL
jgi:hypothetical protein